MTTKTEPKQLTWESLTAGTTIRIKPNGATGYWFLLTKTAEPSYTFSPYAWLQGKRVTVGGKPAAQISHLGLPEGERREFAYIETVTMVSGPQATPAQVAKAADRAERKSRVTSPSKPLDRMTLAELRAYAVAAGFSTITKAGKKSDMLLAIRTMQAHHPERYSSA